MPWLAIPFDEDIKRFKLAEKLGISKVPSLVFLDGNGHVLTTEGLDVVFNDPDGVHLFRMRSKAQQAQHGQDISNNVGNGHTAYVPNEKVDFGWRPGQRPPAPGSASRHFWPPSGPNPPRGNPAMSSKVKK